MQNGLSKENLHFDDQSTCKQVVFLFFVAVFSFKLFCASCIEATYYIPKSCEKLEYTNLFQQLKGEGRAVVKGCNP